MKNDKKILIQTIAFLLLIVQSLLLQAADHPLNRNLIDTVPSGSVLKKIGNYVDSMMGNRYRDSVLQKITKHNEPEPAEDDRVEKKEQTFSRHRGKIIRNIVYRRIRVFGPRDIHDTAFTTTMKLIDFANKIHSDSREWVIRQALFFRKNDRINPYELADNERYLRNLPFIQDARIHIVNTKRSPDSVDVMVVTKDIFEYGGNLSKLTTKAFRARIYNNNLLGAAQELQVGTLWNSDYDPVWNTELRYTKFNAAGTFADVSVGYTALNNNYPLDTGVYERSYYFNINRPLYRTSAKLAGGLMLAENHSMNVSNLSDNLYRDYEYRIIDVWAGYNFRNQFRNDGSIRRIPNLAVVGRHYNVYFHKKPLQEVYASDPIYNNRRYVLGQFVVFKQSFFQTRYFFGYGRTEDIPSGYTALVSFGKESWLGRKRTYGGIEGEKFWKINEDGLIKTNLGVGTFWLSSSTEDIVVHVSTEHYSGLLERKRGRFRQFSSVDYLACPSNHFYKPLNINRERGIWGYKNLMLNGYQRLNLRTETVYYSPLKIYGFKFNFYGSLQSSLLASNEESIFKSPIYTGIGLGCRIRNENLSLNTLRFSVNYFPNSPAEVKPFLFEITTITDFRFHLSSLKAPTFLVFD